MRAPWAQPAFWRRPFLLIAVGAASTLAYGAMALLGTALTVWPAAIVSLFAYAAASLLSYQGHRALTFSLAGPHGAAPLRFAALGAVGYGVAFVLPLLMTDGLGLPATAAIAMTCVVAPALNAVALSRFVFRSPLLGDPAGGSR